MTARLAVTLTTDELADLIRAGVREVLDERGAVDERGRDLASEEMTVKDLIALFHLSTKNGPKTIHAWRRDRGFPAPRKTGGNRVTYLRSEVDEWRRRRELSGPGAPPEEFRRKRRTEGNAAVAAS